jgi:hypothetical protein
MRIILNIALVVVALPFVGITFLLVMLIMPVSAHEFKWPSHIYIIGMWLLSAALLIFVYVKRTKWLENIGIYKSWSSMKAYLTESHGYPEISEKEKQEFLSWANLTEERPSDFRKTIENIYNRIHSEVVQKEKKLNYIKCLAWYATGWPVHEDYQDLEEDN